MNKEKISNIIMIVISIILIIVIVNLYKVAFQREMVILESKTENKIKESKALAIMYETSAGSGEYTASDETTWPSEGYVFNTTLSKCENGSTISYDGTNVKVIASKSDRCYVYFDRILTLADKIKSLYTTDGKNGLYLHDGEGDYGSYEAGDNSYRYAGASDSVNNYVCFGSDVTTCPTDNLYRIIGVFGTQVKLIKAEYATTVHLGTDGDYASDNSYYWNNNTKKNTWSESLLNKTNLNTNYINYLNGINSKWANYITAPSEGWIVGGNTWANIGTQNAKTAYTNEIISPADSATSTNKIGLMYVSDCMYGASPEYWSYVGYNISDSTQDYRAAIDDNWMYMGDYEWTLSRYSDYTNVVFTVASDGGVHYDDVLDGYAVRPVFYLASSVAYDSGDGSAVSPFKVKL